MANEEISHSGLSDKQAQEFHKFFISGFMWFTAIAVVAHILVWMWRPWIPGKNGYTSMLDFGQSIMQTLLT